LSNSGGPLLVAERGGGALYPRKEPGYLARVRLPIGSPIVEGSLFQGRYEVGRYLGSGGMGAVYEVVHLTTRRRHALKLMLPRLVADPGMRARFELEARVTSRVASEHLVETFDAGVDETSGTPFLMMELLRGEDLGTILGSRGALPPDEVLSLLRQAALALERTHAAGIVHRDLKPANLFVSKRDDGSPHLKILDFGIAKLVAQSPDSVRTTCGFGTPVYMSPEQVRGDGDIDFRADLYSLAHIAYTLLVGRPYWAPEASESATMWPLIVKIMAGAIDAATTRAAAAGVLLPAAFDPWFARATALDPGDRFASSQDLVAALADALASEPLVWPEPPFSCERATTGHHPRAEQPALRAARPSKLLRLATAVVAVGALAAISAGAASTTRRPLRAEAAWKTVETTSAAAALAAAAPEPPHTAPAQPAGPAPAADASNGVEPAGAAPLASSATTIAKAARPRARKPSATPVAPPVARDPSDQRK
jgi:hypothetical protein